MTFAQCPECQSDASSNKRGCGTLAQAQAPARVDVPTARVFPAWTNESNACASFRANAWISVHQSTDRDPESFNVNAWICACQATDRDLETKKWMLGYEHGRQPTVILREFQREYLNRQPTVILREFQRGEKMLEYVRRGQPTMILHSIKICNICDVISFGFIVFAINLVFNIRNLMGNYCFGINEICVIVSNSARMVTEGNLRMRT